MGKETNSSLDTFTEPDNLQFFTYIFSKQHQKIYCAVKYLIFLYKSKLSVFSIFSKNFTFKQTYVTNLKEALQNHKV